MTDKLILPRRRFLTGAAAGAGGLMLSGCDAIVQSPVAADLLDHVGGLNRGLQRAVSPRDALAREYRPDERSPMFRTNGNTMPGSAAYLRHMATNFADWRIPITGLVARPLELSMDRLRSLPQRAQITRHDCVEGWSAIGQWQGPQLGPILKMAGLSDQARYIVFRCADNFGDRPYYESIDLVDAFHPQTILAWQMNGQRLPIGHGAPVRMRIERQLGYKQAKFVEGIEAVASLDGIYGGKGGYWEDVARYEWYAGI